jgi:amino acid adenylation domain-containing protein
MIIKKFEETFAQYPENVAVKTDQKELTYTRLNVAANRVASTINQWEYEHLDGKRGSCLTIALLLEPGVEMVASILGVLKANKLYVPLNVTDAEDWLIYMLKDSDAYFILTNNRNLSLAKQLASNVKKDLQIVNIEALDPDQPDNFKRNPSDNRWACLLYTSASFGKLKGVVQDHRNILYYIENWAARFSITPGDRIALTFPFSHHQALLDMFGALLKGAGLYLYNIEDITDLTGFSQWLIKEKISIWHSVPTIFRYFTGIVAHSLPGNEKFPHLRYIILGEEPIRAHDIDLYKTFFPGSGLVTVYGQAESSVTAIDIITPDESTDRITIGDPLDETDLLVVNREGEILDDLDIGEIVVTSEYISPGYWNDPQQNHNDFSYDPNLGKLLFTGELGRKLLNGRIEYIGKVDQKRKISWFKMQTRELETLLLEHESIKEAVVVEREDENGDKYLCAYMVMDAINRPANISELKNFLSQHLPVYMIPSQFIRLGKMPLTPAKTIDIKALPNPNLLNGFKKKYTAPGDEIEEKLVEIWSKNLNIKQGYIGINTTYFELGGNSQKAASLMEQIHKELEVKIPVAEIFRTPTIKELAQYVNGAAKIKYKPISNKKAKEVEYYDLTAAQKRLFLLQLMDPHKVSYNLPKAVVLEGVLDHQRLEKAFAGLIKRHEVLRTSFHLVNGEPGQKIHKDVEFEIEYHCAKRKEQCAERNEDRQAPGAVRCASTIKNFVRPFDLAQAPLLRVVLIQKSQTEYILVLDIHHIITDSLSNQLLVKEMMAMYAGDSLPPLQIQYKDFFISKNQLMQTHEVKQQGQYWRDTFSNEIPIMEFPLDYPRPFQQDHRGNTYGFKMNKEMRKALLVLQQRSGATLFMVLMAVYNVLLMRYCRQEDIVVGTLTDGRSHPHLENMLGLFTATLAIRNKPEQGKPFVDFLAEVKENCLQAFKNSDYPFEELLETINVERTLSRSPLFDIMLILQDVEEPQISSPGLLIRSHPFRPDTSIFDLRLTVKETGDKQELEIEIEYAVSLFKLETIKRLAHHYLNIVKEVTANDRKRLGDIQFISQEEKNQILSVFNDTQVEYPKHKTLQQLVEQQVEKTPDVNAVGFEDQCITYNQLNQGSNQLAMMLKHQYGIQEGDMVGIHITRSLVMVIIVLGVLKANGICLPLDPHHPGERMNLVLKDSRAGVILTSAGQEFDSPLTLQVVEIELEKLHAFEKTNINRYPTSPHPAYVIYTSGSTGIPKGVILSHLGISNHLFAIIIELGLSSADILCHNLSISYVVAIWQIFAPLMLGSRLIIYPEEVIMNSYQLFMRAAYDHAAILEVVPSFLHSYLKLLESGKKKIHLKHLKLLILTGEKVEISLVRQFYQYYDINLMNAYGQSENSDDTLYYRIPANIERLFASIPVGRPSHNTQAYVLDTRNRLLPVGVPGELAAAGDGIALGYLNRPERTAEKFVDQVTGSLNHGDRCINKKLLRGVQGGSFLEKRPRGRRRQKIYKTGDLVRWLADGNIEFLARMDHQVKVRGYRIELGEIESQLLRYDGIREAVAVVKTDREEEKYLCAYLTLKGEDGSPSLNVDIGELREFLSRYLPGYMVPLNFILVEKIPLTPSGKIDRMALYQLEGMCPATAVSYAPPETGTEKLTADIWKDILKIDQVGIHDNFFDLGGNSFNIVKINSKLNNMFSLDIPMVKMFAYSTIHTLAKFIEMELDSAGKENGETSIPAKKKRFEIFGNTNQLIRQKRKIQASGV